MSRLFGRITASLRVRFDGMTRLTGREEGVAVVNEVVVTEENEEETEEEEEEEEENEGDVVVDEGRE